MSSIPFARDWFGSKEAAAYLGVHVSWLKRHKAECPPSYIIGGMHRYMRAELDAWLETQRPANRDRA